MSPETQNTVVLALMLTLALIAGWLAGASERRTLGRAEWNDHVEQALKVVGGGSDG